MECVEYTLPCYNKKNIQFKKSFSIQTVKQTEKIITDKQRIDFMKKNKNFITDMKKK